MTGTALTRVQLDPFSFFLHLEESSGFPTPHSTPVERPGRQTANPKTDVAD
jgi:hypothetical protein